MYRGIRMNIHEINDVLKDVGITGDLLDLINIKLKKHPKSQHIPVGIYEDCFHDDPEDDMPIIANDDPEDDMPILPQQKRKIKVIGKKVIKKGNYWKEVAFNHVLEHIKNHSYRIRFVKFKQVKLRYIRQLKTIMRIRSIKTLKDIKKYYEGIGLYYLYKSCKTKKDWINAYGSVYTERWREGLYNTPDMLYYKNMEEKS